MKAVVFYGKGDLRVENEFPLPTLRDDEVLVRVKACGVCGTDMHIYAGAQGATDCHPPVILGHELAGVVEKVGPGVTRVQAGQHVTVDPNISCGACDACRRGDPHFCDRMSATGVNHHGGFAQYCAVLEKQVFPIAPSVPFEEAAMCEPLACCLHGMDLSGVRCGDTVLIVGGGTIGMLMLQLARLSGAARIAMLETNEARFALARRLGADAVFNPVRGDTRQALASGGFDNARVVVECVGRPETVQNAIEYAGKGATVMIFGLTAPDASVPFYPFEAFKKELTIRTSYVNPHTQGRASQMIASGRLNLRELMGQRLTLEELPGAFAQGITGGKAVVLP